MRCTKRAFLRIHDCNHTRVRFSEMIEQSSSRVIAARNQVQPLGLARTERLDLHVPNKKDHSQLRAAQRTHGGLPYVSHRS